MVMRDSHASLKTHTQPHVCYQQGMSHEACHRRHVTRGISCRVSWCPTLVSRLLASNTHFLCVSWLSVYLVYLQTRVARQIEVRVGRQIEVPGCWQARRREGDRATAALYPACRVFCPVHMYMCVKVVGVSGTCAKCWHMLSGTCAKCMRLHTAVYAIYWWIGQGWRWMLDGGGCFIQSCRTQEVDASFSLVAHN